MNRMKKFSAAVMLTTSLSYGQANAGGGQLFTGNTLLSACKANSSGIALCLGYVAAVSDLLSADALAASEFEFTACVPEGVIVEQIKETVLKSLERYPQYRHLNAAVLVATSISKAFPCPNKSALTRSKPMRPGRTNSLRRPWPG